MIKFLLVAGLLLQLTAFIMLYQANRELDKSLKETLIVAEEVKSNYKKLNEKLQIIATERK